MIASVTAKTITQSRARVGRVESSGAGMMGLALRFMFGRRRVDAGLSVRDGREASGKYPAPLPGVHLDPAPDCQRAGARRLRRFIVRQPASNHFIDALRTSKRRKR